MNPNRPGRRTGDAMHSTLHHARTVLLCLAALMIALGVFAPSPSAEPALLDQDTAQLEQQLQAAREELAQLEQQLQQTEQQLAALRSEGQALQQEIQQLEQQLQAAREELAQLEQALLQTEQQLALLRSQKQALQQQITEAEQKLVELRARPGNQTGPVRRLNDEITALKAQKQQLDQQIAQLEQQAQTINQELAQIEQEIQQTEQQIAAAREEQAQLQQQIQQTEQQVLQLEQQIQQLEQEIQRLEQEIQQPPPPPAEPETSIVSWTDHDSEEPVDEDGNGTETTLVAYTVANADGAQYSLNGGAWISLGASPADVTVSASGQESTIQVRAVRSTDGAADPTPASARITMCPQGGCLPAPPEQTMTNPFANEQFYVDPNSSAMADYKRFLAEGNTLAAQNMKKIAFSPSDPYYMAEWTERHDGIGFYTDYFIRQYQSAGAVPTLGLYAIPNRDCGSYSGGGFTTDAEYMAWINKAAAAQGTRKVIWILEPDAVPYWECLSSTQIDQRVRLLRYAIDKLATNPNAYVYIDAGHSGWHSPQTIIDRLNRIGIQNAAGFTTNTSNFNWTHNEVAWAKQVSAGVGNKPFVIDTSRNGLGPYTLGTHSGDCPPQINPPGRALGARPTANTGDPLIHAFFWLKQPGESDGACGGYPGAGQWMTDYALGLASRASWTVQ